MAKHFMQFEHNQSNYLVRENFVTFRSLWIEEKQQKIVNTQFHMYIFRIEMNIVPDSEWKTLFTSLQSQISEIEFFPFIWSESIRL